MALQVYDSMTPNLVYINVLYDFLASQGSLFQNLFIQLRSLFSLNIG